MTLTASHRPATGSGAPRRLTLAELLDAAVARRPDAVALVDGADRRRRWTQRELAARSRRVAAALLERFEPGDHVALWAPNSTDWILFQLGAGLAGLVLVTVNPAYRHAELEHVLRQSRARGLYFAPEHRGRDLEAIARATAAGIPAVEVVERLDELVAREAPARALPALTADAVAQIQYTSGTTGAPKGAMLTHGGLSAAYDLATRRAGLGDDAPPVWIDPMPLFHVGGAGFATVGTLARAGTHVLMDGFDAGRFLELAEAERATVTLAVPTMLTAILDHPDLRRRDVASLRTILTGGTTVPRELVLRVRRELGAQVLITFGQTECHGTMCMTRPGDSPEDIAETVGVPLDHVEVEVAHPESGETLPLATPGEILVRSHQVMAGYHDAPAETAAAIRPDGWLRTGDLGTMDERGYLRVIGRLKDMVIRGGENVYPREIEELLLAHPGVDDVAVVGAPDPLWGEEVAAVVRATGDRPSADALYAYCRDRLAGYKCPRLWFFVEELPTTASGKVRKHVLADLIAGGELRPAASFLRRPRSPRSR